MIDDKCKQNRKINSNGSFVSPTAYDFQYVNEEGKLTLPWINNDAMKEINVLQKDIFTTPSSNFQDLEVVSGENGNKLKLDASNELVTINQWFKLKKHRMPRTKTIKIPFVTFVKIHNFRYPPIFTMDSDDTQLETQNEASLKVEEISELDDTKVNILGENKFDKGINQTNELDRKIEVNQKTIKLPFSTFKKLTHTASKRHFQSKRNNEKVELSYSERNLKVKDKFVLDGVLDKKTGESNSTNRDNKDLGNNKYSNKINIHTNVRSKKIIIPFSTFVEVDNFLHPPIFGGTIQHTFSSHEEHDRQIPSFNTKIIDTTTFYHENPYCHLLGFKSHEIVFSTKYNNIDKESWGKGKGSSLVVAIPLHAKENIVEKNNLHLQKRLNIRVPVIVGEYNIELCIVKAVLFEDQIFQVKEISKEVEVKDCKFIPESYSNPNEDGARTVEKGKLFLEGFIKQQIEYNTLHDTNESVQAMNLDMHLYPLHQKIVLELNIQLLQVQKSIMTF